MPLMGESLSVWIRTRSLWYCFPRQLCIRKTRSNGQILGLKVRTVVCFVLGGFLVLYPFAHFTITAASAREAIVYELHIPSFTVAGTFDSVVGKLGYLVSLGVTHIELMPVTTFPHSPESWGYDPATFAAPMAEFGGYNGLKRLVNAAHEAGLGVILDVVFNHVDSHNILTAFDGYAGTSGNGIYFYETGQNAETAWGPRPAFHTQQVADYIFDTVKMFVSQYHIDGFRWDATVCIRKPGTSCWTNADNLVHGWKLMQAANSLVPSTVITIAEDDQGKEGLGFFVDFPLFCSPLTH